MNQKEEIAKEFIDTLIYDNDFVNRWIPFDESKHYGDWIGKVGEKVFFPDDDKEWWSKDDRIGVFAVGDYDDKEDMIKKYPELRELDKVLNDYFDYLEETFKI